MIPGSDTFYLACAMQHQKDSISLLQMVLYRLYKCGLDIIKCCFFNNTTGTSICINRRNELNSILIKCPSHPHFVDAILTKSDIILLYCA